MTNENVVQFLSFQFDFVGLSHRLGTETSTDCSDAHLKATTQVLAISIGPNNGVRVSVGTEQSFLYRLGR